MGRFWPRSGNLFVVFLGVVWATSELRQLCVAEGVVWVFCEFFWMFCEFFGCFVSFLDVL